MKILSFLIEILIFLVVLFYGFFCSIQLILVTENVNGIVSNYSNYSIFFQILQIIQKITFLEEQIIEFQYSFFLLQLTEKLKIVKEIVINFNINNKILFS